MELERVFGDGREEAILDAAGELFDLLAELGDLEDHRARVERIEHQEVDRALYARMHRVAPAMRHDAIADLEQHLERPIRRVLARQPGGDAGDLDAALEPAADLQEAPAGEAVHVL